MISIYKSSNNILYYSYYQVLGFLFSALLRLKVPEVSP